MDTTKDWDEALAAWVGIRSAPARENRGRSAGFSVMTNTFLERWIATSHWLMPGVWFLPVIVACLYSAMVADALPWWQVGLAFVAGVLAWTFVEYWLHRWFFHLEPPENALGRYILFIAHGYHHEFPNDPGRLVAPPLLSWPIFAGLVALYSTFGGVWWMAGLAGTVSGYLGYDWMHYYTHHGRPTNPWLKKMRKFHLEHHFKHHQSRFGLSSPLWDWVFGTMGSDKAHESAVDELRQKDTWAV
jgi:sterol desaturase/sphingolipid hydroxylase (fatty acid hydroxylase superfamily)